MAGAAVGPAQDREDRRGDDVPGGRPPLEQGRVEVGGDVVAVGEQDQRIRTVLPIGGRVGDGVSPLAPVAGYQNSVGIVRSGAPPNEPFGDVGRDGSTNVSVRVPTA